MDISHWHSLHFEARIRGRYLAPKHLLPLLDFYAPIFEISMLGPSEKKQHIHCLKVGKGKIKVLAWSQMHGNESTTTKALFDFLKFLSQKEHFQEQIETFLASYTLYIIPQLNPDGAALYTRENANGIDLNRDAQALSQAESRVLSELFNELRPDLCLNLHDQRSIYSLPKKETATVSFLAPAANIDRTITASRKIAMAKIVKMQKALQRWIPGKVGRYDDSFNPSCVGDTFQMAGVPTILFEAGHYPEDYEREKTRAYIFYAFCALFDMIETEKSFKSADYFNIPENKKDYLDIIIRNVRIKGEEGLFDLGIQFQEVLENEKIKLTPVLEEIGDLKEKIAHQSMDAKSSEILVNNYENVFVNMKIDKIVDKNAINTVFFKDSCKTIG